MYKNIEPDKCDIICQILFKEFVMTTAQKKKIWNKTDEEMRPLNYERQDRPSNTMVKSTEAKLNDDIVDMRTDMRVEKQKKINSAKALRDIAKKRLDEMDLKKHKPVQNVNKGKAGAEKVRKARLNMNKSTDDTVVTKADEIKQKSLNEQIAMDAKERKEMEAANRLKDSVHNKRKEAIKTANKASR